MVLSSVCACVCGFTLALCQGLAGGCQVRPRHCQSSLAPQVGLHTAPCWQRPKQCELKYWIFFGFDVESIQSCCFLFLQLVTQEPLTGGTLRCPVPVWLVDLTADKGDGRKKINGLFFIFLRIGINRCCSGQSVLGEKMLQFWLGQFAIPDGRQTLSFARCFDLLVFGRQNVMPENVEHNTFRFSFQLLVMINSWLVQTSQG